MDKRADQLDPITSPVAHLAGEMTRQGIVGAGIGGVAGLFARNPGLGVTLGASLGALEGGMRAKNRRDVLLAQLGIKSASAVEPAAFAAGVSFARERLRRGLPL